MHNTLNNRLKNKVCKALISVAATCTAVTRLGRKHSVLCNHFRQILEGLDAQLLELIGLAYEVSITIP